MSDDLPVISPLMQIRILRLQRDIAAKHASVLELRWAVQSLQFELGQVLQGSERDGYTLDPETLAYQVKG